MLLLLVCCQTAMAQDMGAIATRYKTENAVITNYSEQIVLKYNNGQLTAKSYVTEEILLISDVAQGIYNTQNVYYDYLGSLEEIEGVSMIPDGKGYKTIKAGGYNTTTTESEDIFYHSEKTTEVSFTGLVKNARTRLTYTIDHKDLHFLPVFYFQKYLPVANATFEVVAPKSVKMRFVLKGDDTDKVKRSIDEKRKEITYTFTGTDLPKAIGYSNAPTLAYYGTHIIPFIESYEAANNDAVVRFLGNEADLYHFYYKFIKDVNTKDDEIIKKTVDEITKGDTTKRQKAEHIYQWVQKNMHYVAFEDKLGGFIPREAGEICKRKYGDCKDMSSIQVALYRKAGIDAYFTWIGTRYKPYTYEETPVPGVDNHMICTIKLDNEWIFLDGTHPFIPFGIPPYSIQGKEALIGINDKEYKILKVPEMPAEGNTVEDNTLIHLSGKDVAGSTTVSYKGYGAWDMAGSLLYHNDNEKKDAIKAITQRGSNKFILNNFDYKIAESKEKEVTVTSQFEVKDYVQNVGNEYYVNLNLLRKYEDERIDSKERKAPIEHSYKNKTKEIVTLEIPQGYHVSYLPPVKQKKADGLWGYSISYTSDKNHVTLIKEYELQTLYIAPAQFAEHNRIEDDLKKQYKESVVLTAN